jgi:hypothetical protein
VAPNFGNKNAAIRRLCESPVPRVFGATPRRRFLSSSTGHRSALPTGILGCQISQIWHFEKASGIEKIKWYFGQNLAYFWHFRKKFGILLKIEILNLTLFVNREKCQLWKA